MDDIVEMEPYDVWMHAKLEEEERMLDVDQAILGFESFSGVYMC